jgi:CspA family cold shock protein
MFQVKWFNTKKGFGFVTNESGTDYFCHHTDINVQGFKYLKAGEYVSGTVGDMEKGKVKVINIGPPVPWGKLMCQIDVERFQKDDDTGDA